MRECPYRFDEASNAFSNVPFSTIELLKIRYLISYKIRLAAMEAKYSGLRLKHIAADETFSFSPYQGFHLGLLLQRSCIP